MLKTRIFNNAIDGCRFEIWCGQERMIFGTDQSVLGIPTITATLFWYHWLFCKGLTLKRFQLFCTCKWSYPTEFIHSRESFEPQIAPLLGCDNYHTTKGNTEKKHENPEDHLLTTLTSFPQFLILVVKASASSDKVKGDVLLDDLMNEMSWKHSSPKWIFSDDKLGMSTFITPWIHTLQIHRSGAVKVLPDSF